MDAYLKHIFCAVREATCRAFQGGKRTMRIHLEAPSSSLNKYTNGPELKMQYSRAHARNSARPVVCRGERPWPCISNFPLRARPPYSMESTPRIGYRVSEPGREGRRGVDDTPIWHAAFVLIVSIKKILVDGTM